MKRKYILIIIPILIFISFLLIQIDEKNFAKIEVLIGQNAEQLVKADKSSSKAEDRKLALEIAAKIQLGECPSHIDAELKSYTIKNLASKKLDKSQAKAVINCIETLGIDKAQHFTLMVDLFAFWNSPNELLELFYSKFFKDYKSSNSSVLGLLDNAKLMCAKAGINYLSQDGYPENVEKSMTDKEYALFIEYIDEYRCGGYAS